LYYARKRMTKKPFGDWLSEYDGNDVTVTDLREDYLRVRRIFPKSDPIITPDDLYLELFSFAGCNEAFEALKTASKLYGGEPLFFAEANLS